MKILPLMLTCLLNLFVVSSTLAGNETQKEQAALSQLMQAISSNDYEAFIANGTPLFKESVSKPSFDSVTNQLGMLVRQGYSVEYLSELYQNGAIVHLWKISYAKSKENSLAKLIMTDSKVAGFWLF